MCMRIMYLRHTLCFVEGVIGQSSECPGHHSGCQEFLYDSEKGCHIAITICPRIGEEMLLQPLKGRKENAEVMCKAEKKDTGIVRYSRFSLLLDLHNSQHACERQSLCYRLQSF